MLLSGDRREPVPLSWFEGRRTGQFKIEPLNYKEIAVFHPEISCADNALIYGITGGVPHYINKLNVKSDVCLEEVYA